jgi:hypothetical protein
VDFFQRFFHQNAGRLTNGHQDDDGKRFSKSVGKPGFEEKSQRDLFIIFLQLYNSIFVIKK